MWLPIVFKTLQQLCSVCVCVHLGLPHQCHSLCFKSWHSSNIAVLQKGKAAKKLPCGFMHYSSSSLPLFFYSSLHCIMGKRGAREKVRGNRMHSSLIQLQHVGGKKTRYAAFTTQWSCSRLWLFDQDKLPCVCTAVLRLSLHDLHSRKTLPFLVYMMSQFLFCPYLHDKGNGSQN